MKNIFIYLLIACSFSSKSERINLTEKSAFVLPFKSLIVTNDLPCKNAIVHLYKFDTRSDSNLVIQTLELKDDGLLNIDIPGDGDYILEITKPGFVHKRFRINTKQVPKGINTFAGIHIESISLFKPIEGVNYKLLDLPLVLITYDEETQNFNYDETYSNIALASLDLIKDLETAHKDVTEPLIGESEKNNSFFYTIILFSVILLVLGIALFARMLRQKK